MDELLVLLRVAAALGVATMLLVIAQRRLGLAVRLPGRGAQPRLCPHLGLNSDPFKHYPGANDEHRCYANLGRERIDLGHQRRFCLASCYARCPFLTVEQKGLLERIWAWARAVSPAAQAWVGVPRRPHGRSPWGSPRLADVAGLLALARPFAEHAWSMLQARAGQSQVVRHWLAAHVSTLRQPRVRAEVKATEQAFELASEYAPVAVMEVQAVQPAPVATHVAMPVCEVVEPVVEQPVLAADLPAIIAEQPVVVEEPAMPMDGDLVERGIHALEAGDEPAAYALFKRASRTDGHDVRAWFWRAKTAETLDEVIECLQRALKLEPSSSQIKANLDWAIQRRQQAKAPDAPRPIEAPERRPRTVAPASLRAANPMRRLLRFIVEVARATTALAAFVVAAVWLLSAMPGELRETILSASGMTSLPLPDAAGFLVSRFGVQLGMLGGYNLASALPYGVGFLALFVGLGLLSAEAWTRLWAPLLALASAWVWLQTGGPAETPAVLVACAMVAMGGVLAFDSASRGRPAAV